MNGLITELSWDSAFFGRKIGELHIDNAQMNVVDESLAQAKDNAFRYLLCKVNNHSTPIARFLETRGFYLTDVAITFAMETSNLVKSDQANYGSIPIRRADHNDIPMAREIAKSLFLYSRFYDDPFFTVEEADNLYQTWIENSIRGNTANIVFLIPHVGFIACRRLKDAMGEIVLIGVRTAKQRQNIGRALIFVAMDWFKSEGISIVSVKTQLKNIPALNFYSRLGFWIKEYSMVFGNIL